MVESFIPFSQNGTCNTALNVKNCVQPTCHSPDRLKSFLSVIQRGNIEFMCGVVSNTNLKKTFGFYQQELQHL